jgi:DNA invertase Pin-like site-specific DNA recombinase
MEKDMKNVAYLRVSTSQQGEQKTIEIQRDRINGYAVSKKIIR